MYSNLDIPFIGAPNSGKTTLYNWLTGSQYRAVNYPGSTVDYSIGKTHARYGTSVSVVDTPGTYSLSPKSADEQVTYDLLFKKPSKLKISQVVVVIDATQLQRHLLLLEQLHEAGFSLIIALTMVDLVEKEGLEIETSLLSEKYNCDVVLIDGLLGRGVQELVQKLQSEPVIEQKDNVKVSSWDSTRTAELIEQSRGFAQSVIHPPKGVTRQNQAQKKNERLDQLFLHPLWGITLFFSIMMGLFSSIFWAATPFMDWIDSGFSALAHQVQAWGEGGLLGRFLADGMIASFGAVFVFVPQIFILFLGIGFLEDSGYLARAATLIDRPFSKLGLSGRSFVPLLSGFACAVPAMMACRNIRSKKERWLTMFILPFMTCSARLPVYALLLSFLFLTQPAWQPGLALTLIYMGSLLLGAIAAYLLNKIVKIESTSSFLMELPYYRKPRAQVVLKSALMRTKGYIRRAGPIIFTLALAIWVGTNFPNISEENSQQRLEQSFLGRAGAQIEPVFAPLGVDWRVGVSLMTAFAAREVFVSSLAVMFSLTEDQEEEQLRAALLGKMQKATNLKGEPIFTLATVVGLVIFFMIALQCLSTTSMAAKEMNSWNFALIQLVSMNALAYFVAILSVQSLRFLGIS